MKKQYFKALGLMMMLAVGVSTVQAQSVNITQGGFAIDPYYCMPADNTGTVFQANEADLSNGTTTGTVVQYTWTATGGIDIIAGAGTDAVTVKPKTGTDYSPGQYSKYAKGKLRVTIRVKHSYEYILYDYCETPPEPKGTETYEYYVNYTTEIEIKKQFSDLTGNEITGPECVKAGQRVTYSVAPWVSMYQLNTVGFDDYYWTIPAGVAQGGVLYYSADKSSVTFVVGNDFDGKTMSVRMGACNPAQTPVTLTLRAEPGAPVLPAGINFSTGWCLPLGAGQQSIALTSTDPSATYIWENLGGWLSNPAETTFEAKSANDYTLSFTPQDDARVLRLKVISACGTEQVYNLTVNRTLSASNNQIQPVSGSACVAPNTVVQFMVTNVGNNVPMTWTITDGASNGWYILPGTETLVQPYIMTGTGSATISVLAAGCTGTPITEIFSVAPKVPVINSGSPVCISNATQKFSVRQADPNATYEWDYPSDWTVQGDDDEGTITLIPGQEGGEVKVRAIGSTGCSSDWSDAIEVAAPLALKKITTCVNAGLPGAIEIEISGYDANVNYNLSIDDETLGAIDQNYGIDANGVFKVNTTGKEGNFTVSVSGTNTCGGETSATLDYEVVKESFEVVELPGIRNMSQYYIVDADDDDWYYSHTATWMYNDGDATGYDYYISSNLPKGLLESGGNDFYVDVTNTSTGCTTRRSNETLGIFRAKAFNNSAETIELSASIAARADMIVTPNPSKGEITVILPEYDKSSNIVLYNPAGTLMKHWRINTVESTFDISDLPNGNYFILANQGKNSYSKQIILNR